MAPRPPGRSVGGVQRRGLFLFGGVVAPGVFVVVTSVAAALQPGYSVADDHLSGLASTAASTRWWVTAAFVVLGVGVGALAAALRHRLSDVRMAVVVLAFGAVCVTAIGLFPRSCVETECLSPTWHDTVHDAVSVPGYATLLALPLLFATRRADIGRWAPAGIAVAAVAAGLIVVLALDPGRSGSGLVQRGIAVVPLVWLAGVTIRLGRGAPLKGVDGRGAAATAGYARIRPGL